MAAASVGEASRMSIVGQNPSPCDKALSRREGGTLNCAPSADAVAGRENRKEFLPREGGGTGEMGRGLIRAAVDLDPISAAIDNVQIASRIELHRRGAPQEALSLAILRDSTRFHEVRVSWQKLLGPLRQASIA